MIVFSHVIEKESFADREHVCFASGKVTQESLTLFLSLGSKFFGGRKFDELNLLRREFIPDSTALVLHTDKYGDEKMHFAVYSSPEHYNNIRYLAKLIERGKIEPAMIEKAKKAI